MLTTGLRIEYRDFPLRKPDADVHRELERGWLVPYLFDVDALTWNRWDYWCRIQEQRALPPDPIPQIEFLDSGHARTRKLWEHIFDQVAPYWQGWSSSEYIGYVLDWFLYGFGHVTELPREPTPGASDRLYQAVDIGPMMLWPYDYLGDIFADMAIGKHGGFYPTPLSLVRLMVEMTMGCATVKDQRLATTCDPCLGTGRMLLLASNHTLSLAGQDINSLIVKAALVNGYLYAPWMVKPITLTWELANSPNGASVNGEHLMPGVALSARARKEIEKGQAVLL
jgi:hypothetical protein